MSRTLGAWLSITQKLAGIDWDAPVSVKKALPFKDFAQKARGHNLLVNFYVDGLLKYSLGYTELNNIYY